MKKYQMDMYNSYVRTNESRNLKSMSLVEFLTITNNNFKESVVKGNGTCHTVFKR